MTNVFLPAVRAGLSDWELTMKWKNAATEKPDADRIVLIYCAGKSVPVWLGYFDDENNKWYGEDGFSLDVTHWMELPEPPAAASR